MAIMHLALLAILIGQTLGILSNMFSVLARMGVMIPGGTSVVHTPFAVIVSELHRFLKPA